MNRQALYQALDTIDWGPVPPINSHHPGIHRETDHWLESVGLTDKPGRLEKHRRIAVPLFAAMAYPTASREHSLPWHICRPGQEHGRDVIQQGLDIFAALPGNCSSHEIFGLCLAVK